VHGADVSQEFMIVRNRLDIVQKWFRNAWLLPATSFQISAEAFFFSTKHGGEQLRIVVCINTL